MAFFHSQLSAAKALGSSTHPAEESLRSSCMLDQVGHQISTQPSLIVEHREPRSSNATLKHTNPKFEAVEDRASNSDERSMVFVTSHLLYQGKCLLRDHPSRMRYFKHSKQRMMALGTKGIQELQPDLTGLGFYVLQKPIAKIKATDCALTKSRELFTIARYESIAVLSSYNEHFMRLNVSSVPYPLGCLTSLATDDTDSYIYGTNLELNCVLRFSKNDLSLTSAERFGVLWRPFDSCVSQSFPLDPNSGQLISAMSSTILESINGDVASEGSVPAATTTAAATAAATTTAANTAASANEDFAYSINDSVDLSLGESQVQFLFVSNIDAGVCVFNLNTMEIVAHCGDDLLPGAKFLAYDSDRSILFVSASAESILRCYRFEPCVLQVPPSECQSLQRSVSSSETLTARLSSPGLLAATMVGAVTKTVYDGSKPKLTKLADFLVGNRQPTLRASGPQCLMWDPDTLHLVVLCYSHYKGKFKNKVFRVRL